MAGTVTSPFKAVSITGILSGPHGGTGNAYMQFAGPATTLKTYTLPNVSDTIACLGTIQAFTVVQTMSSLKLSDTSNQLIFQSAGVTGTLSWAPATSNKVLTLPNGTTDFTATGGSGQYVKQSAAGAALTVAAVLMADLPSATGLTSAAVGDILYASATTPVWSRLADVATGSVLISGGVNAAPSYSASPTLTTSLTTPIHYGGTAAGSTLTLAGTSSGAPVNAYVVLNGTGQGNVGIGVATPAAPLEVRDTSDASTVVAKMSGSNSSVAVDVYSAIQINPTTGLVLTNEIRSIVESAAGGNRGIGLAFLTHQQPVGMTEKMRITWLGQVGIGIAAPVSIFHIATNTTAVGLTLFEQASADADSYDLTFRKTRGTVASPTVITTVDELGTIRFDGYSGAGGYVTGAAIKAISEGTVATTRIPANLSFWTGTDAAPTVLTQRMVIDSAGKVGIATALPLVGFHLSGAPGIFRIQDTAGIQAGFLSNVGTITQLSGNRNPSTGVFVDTAATGAVINLTCASGNSTIGLFTSPTNNTTPVERIRIDKDGNVGIVTTAPASLFHIATNTTAVGLTLFEQASADADSYDLTFRKTRGTVASPTVITTADELGTLRFDGYSGAGGYVTGAAIKAISEGTIATTRVPAHMSFWTGTNAAPSVLTERMRIEGGAGKVGIGTTAPSANLHVTQTATATGVLKGFIFTGAVHTNQTLSTEISAVILTVAGRQWATGDFALQREVLITQPTYTFVGSSTITDAATLGIAGAPIRGTNALFSNTHALLIQAGAVSTATASYGITVNAQTGATTNYCAALLGGRVGIGTAIPTAQLHLPAGAAAANGAPFKLTSGTNLTTAEAGAMEYDGTDLYFTRAGTVRENVLVAIDNVAAPTATAGTTITNYYGSSATNFLGTPNRWLSVNVLNATYKIALYT